MPRTHHSQTAPASRALAHTALLAALSLALGCADDLERPPSAYAAASLTRGAHLYDDWQTVTGVVTSGDNPGYAQTLGTAHGAGTWRCKECHGVDYRGVDGFYATGSHFTGVRGLLPARFKDEQTLFDAIRGPCLGPGGVAAGGAWLSDGDVWALVKFVRDGVVDLTPNMDPAGVPTLGDVAAGKALYTAECSRCHGADGANLNIGSAAAVSYIGTEAVKNGYNFTHRVRFGLAAAPGTFKQEMPAAVNFGWTPKNVADVLTYARTLPQK